ncbi:unnamed protein product [Adineta steineri]|uniref:NAD(P)(+)--arginine ADP-ribosyltransferase n=1 Tax=Adineta steineri TaxID=433720 RepID=A0A815KCZ7_9BILA|nr:unnamed protein product [Adineta steineri]CAF3837339.1 unnamed protein product [Adineta steineri]
MISKCSEISETTLEQPARRFQNVTRNSDEYILISFDENTVFIKENLAIQKAIRQIIPDLKIFDNSNACVDYLMDFKDRKIVLIICGSYDHRFISLIHHLSHLSAIYVYHLEEQAAEEWNKDYEKIKGVFTQIKDLITTICTDQRVHRVSSISCFDKQQTEVRDGLERIAANTIAMNIYSTQNTTDVSEERDLRNAAFMYFQVLINILLDITSNRNPSAKKDLLDHFKHIYEGSTAEERIIQELENNYRDEEAIRWYTRPTFLYNTLNKALRDFDFEVLFALRFLINDLQRQLAIAHETYLTSYELENPIITVYRGQNISVADLNYLHQNIGQFVAMQSFLSTSFDRAVASFFAQAAAPTTDEITCILFEFHLDTRIMNTKPYANIKHLSYFRDEEELLIMLGTIFRIEQVEYNELEKTWIANLSLCSEDDYELKELVKHLKNETGEGITSLGNLLQRQGDYERARLYFQQLLLDPSLGDLDRARCYRGLAMVA